MDRAIKLIKLACLVSLTLALIFLMGVVSGLVRDVRETLRKFDAVIANVTRAAANAADASATAKDAAAEQKKYWEKTSIETYKTIASLRLTIIRTNRSINDELVPRLVTNLQDTDVLTRDAAKQLDATMAGLRPTLDNLARSSASAADALSDPAIRETLGHLNEAAAHTADSTKQLDMTMTDLRLVADRFRETYLKPGSTIWATLKAFLHLAFETRGALGK